MEPKVHLSVNGQSVNQDDFNAVAREASMNAEYIWAQLLRLAPSGAATSFTPVTGIIPSGGQASAFSQFHAKSLLGGNQANDATITIQPFVAVIGSRADQAATPTGPHDDASYGPRDGLREIRLAPHFGQVDHQFQTLLQVPASAGNNRWDVFYAKVDIDVADPVAPRYEKIGESAINAVAVSVVDRTKVTVIRASGVEATNPVKPAIPTDGGGSYHILLGYYFVTSTHTLTSSISAAFIHEAYAPLLVSPANGGSRMRPVNGAFHDSGFAWAIEQWSNTRGKPVTHLSPSMVGEEKAIVAINAQDSSGHASHPPNTVTVLDDTIDWRKRIFTTIIEAAPASGGGEGFPWVGATNGNLFASKYSPSTYLRAGQSFQNNLVEAETGDPAAVGSIVVFLDDSGPSPSVASGSKLCIFVQASTGRLCVWRNNANADRRVLAIISATGRFANTDASGL